jgi:hypothetical protein
LPSPPPIALTIVGFALATAALFTHGHIGAGEREDRGNRWVTAAFGSLVCCSVMPAYTESLGILTIDGDAVRWIGVVLNGLGGALRIYPVFVTRPPLQRSGRHSTRPHAGDR